MAWVKGGDGAGKSRRVLRAGHGGFLRKKGPTASPQQERSTIFGFVSLCVSWSAGEYTDLFIPEYTVQDVAGPEAAWMVKAAIKAGFFGPRERDKEGDWGWPVIDNGDHLFHVRSLDEVTQDRDRRNHNRRDAAANIAIYARDGDDCRYCLRSVTPWVQRGGDHQTARSRTLDRVDPADPSTDRVVACRLCNSEKGDRTPAEWAAEGGRLLTPPPDDPRFHATTVETFVSVFTKLYGDLDQLPAAVRVAHEEQSKAKAKPASKVKQATVGVPEQVPPGRVGSSALLGSALDGSGPSPAAGLAPVPAPRDDGGNVRRLPVRDDNGTPEAG